MSKYETKGNDIQTNRNNLFNDITSIKIKKSFTS